MPTLTARPTANIDLCKEPSDRSCERGLFIWVVTQALVDIGMTPPLKASRLAPMQSNSPRKCLIIGQSC